MTTKTNKSDRRMLFAIVKKHLLKQNEQAKDGHHCQYHKGKMRCAVGCLITKKYYDSNFEGCGIGNDGSPINEQLRQAVNDSQGVKMDQKCINMLSDLQALHDDSDPKDWAHNLDALEANLIKHGVLE